MSSADSTEADLLPFLATVKKEDLITWQQFGNATVDALTDLCKYWGLNPLQIVKVLNIHRNHPAKRKASQQSK